MTELTAIARAVTLAGSQTKLAKLLGCTPQNVQRMCSTGKVPGKHVLNIETATGVSRSDLRPDLYPEEPPTLNTNLRAISTFRQTFDPSVHSYSSGL